MSIDTYDNEYGLYDSKKWEYWALKFEENAEGKLTYTIPKRYELTDEIKLILDGKMAAHSAINVDLSFHIYYGPQYEGIVEIESFDDCWIVTLDPKYFSKDTKGEFWYKLTDEEVIENIKDNLKFALSSYLGKPLNNPLPRKLKDFNPVNIAIRE